MTTDERYLEVLTQPEGSFEATDLDVSSLLGDVEAMIAAEGELDDHPSFNGLREFHEDEAMREQLADHVDGCALCQSVVDAFEPSEALVGDFLEVAAMHGGLQEVDARWVDSGARRRGLQTPASGALGPAETQLVTVATDMVSAANPVRQIEAGSVSIRIELND